MDSSIVEDSRLTGIVDVSTRDSKSNENKADTDDESDTVNTHTDTKGASSPAADNDSPTTAVTVVDDDAQVTVQDAGKFDILSSLKEKERFEESFFSNAPVFPARQDGEIGDMSSVNNGTIKTVGKSGKGDEKNDRDPISFQYDIGAINSDVISHRNVSPSQDVGKGEDYTKHTKTFDKKETPPENDVPLSSYLFSCQYQTPSWIDDPLIGVPSSAMENKNTHRKTGADMRILTAYMRSLNEMRLPEAIPPDELDKYLSSFFLVVRKADGSEYEPCSLRAMLASIERYLRFKNYPLSLTRDSAFSNMRNVLKLKQQTLRSIGKGQKGQTEVTPSTLAKEGKIAHLFKSQEMGPYTPSSVVFTLCFYFCMYLRLRKSTENKKLLWGDIVLCKDDSGREFLTFSSQMLRQTQGSSKLNLKQRSYRVWADPSCPEKDPVTIYKFYAQKRPMSMNTNMAPFYLGINVLYPTQGQPWYRPAAMGINKLNEMVRQIRDMTGIRSTSDFHGEIQINDKGSEGDAGSTQSDHSPFSETTERQDLDGDINLKHEMSEDNDNSNGLIVAMDFSHDRKDSPDPGHFVNKLPQGSVSQGFESGLTHTSCSDGDSNDSFPLQSFDANHQRAVNGNDNTSQELDLTKPNLIESPLNCSIRSRDSQNDLVNGVCSTLQAPDFLSLSEAKDQLISIVQRMEASDVIQMNGWLKKISFCPDPFSGKIVCKDVKEPVAVSARSIRCEGGDGKNGSANITLNISLSPEALQPGGGPITITTQTVTESAQEDHQPFHRSSPDCCNTRAINQIPFHSSSSSPGPKTNSMMASSRRNSSSSSAMDSSLIDKPLDLATSPLHRNNKYQHSSHINNTTTASSTTSTPDNNGNLRHTTNLPSYLFDQPLAKRLRLSAEQAEAYASASIMASLSSTTNLVNERLRLQLMQAAGFPLDGQGQNMDLAASEVFRSQLLQHYGIKSEPK